MRVDTALLVVDLRDVFDVDGHSRYLVNSIVHTLCNSHHAWYVQYWRRCSIRELRTLVAPFPQYSKCNNKAFFEMHLPPALGLLGGGIPPSCHCWRLVAPQTNYYINCQFVGAAAAARRHLVTARQAGRQAISIFFRSGFKSLPEPSRLAAAAVGFPRTPPPPPPPRVCWHARPY